MDYFQTRPDFKGIETLYLVIPGLLKIEYFQTRPDFKGIETLHLQLSVLFVPRLISKPDPTLRGLRHFYLFCLVPFYFLKFPNQTRL